MVELLRQLFEIEDDFESDEAKQRSGLLLLLAQKDSCIFVAEQKGLIVGMCTMQTVISTAEGRAAGLLEDLVVDDKHRGQGIGKLLVEAVCQWAKDRNIERIQLLADKYNLAALNFYQNTGWIKTNLICLRQYIGKGDHGFDGT